MPVNTRFSRRKFLAGSAAAAAPLILPQGVLARNGRPGANDRIVIANIGVGGMGRNHVGEDTAAICDVDANHLADAAKRVTQGKPGLYKDYRYILDRKDIDAVIIATPDHWHALQTVHACQAGKHVMSEKPTCKTIEEGRAMVNAARYYNRTVQIHAQGRSNPTARLACQYVRNGMIGRIKRVDIWHPPNFTTDSWGEPQAVPAYLDWEMWLGPAPWAPYHPQRAHFNFRWFMDSGGGFIRDRGNHAISVVFWLTQMDNYRGRVSCEATGSAMRQGFYDVPGAMNVRWDFEDPEWTLTWTQPGTANPRMPGDWGATYTGDKDDLIVLGGDGGCDTEQKAKDFKVPAGGVEMPDTGGHRENWLNCIRTGERPVMDVEIAYRVITLPIIANISYLLGRKVTFDMAKEQFVGDETANRMLRAPYRKPWALEDPGQA